MLKTKYENENEIPESYKELFTESNGLWILTQVAGLKTDDDVRKLSDSLTAERESHKQTKSQIGKITENFGGLELEEVVNRLSKYEELELLAKNKGVDDETVNKLVETRINGKIVPLEREKEKLMSQLEQLSSTVEQYKQRDITNEILSIGKKAAIDAGVAAVALPDVELYLKGMFEKNEYGDVVTKDGVGVTPGLDPKTWLADVAETKPHWFGETSSVGSKGNAKSGKAVLNPWNKNSWNVTEQIKIKAEDRKNGTDRAKQLQSMAK